MKKFLYISAIIVVVAIVGVLLSINSYRWYKYQYEFVHSLGDLQVAILNYYADNRQTPDLVTIDAISDSINPITERFFTSERWILYPCEATGHGYEMKEESGYVCLEVIAPMRALCAAEMIMDDKSLSTGIGIAPDFVQKNHRFTRCEIIGRKKVKYIYHIF